MNKQAQVEMLYNSKKKSKLLAYALGFLLGGVGAHYFVLGENSLGFLTIGLMVLGLVIPVLLPIHLIWVFWGVIHTNMLADKVNDAIRLECEMLVGE